MASRLLPCTGMRALDTAGFSLIEVLIASAILAAAVLSVAQLFATASTTTAAAHATSAGTIAAWQKIEQLRSLAYAVDKGGAPVTDRSTDTGGPEDRGGGTGLAFSPAGVLTGDTPGYVDYLDAFGHALVGPRAPIDAQYRRRWAITAAPNGMPGLLVLRVRVIAARTEDEIATAVTLRARTAR